MAPNFLILLIAALVPMVMGFIWYNPKVFGTAWMNVAGLTKEKMQGGNMAVIFILSYVFSILLAMGLMTIVIHQFSVYSWLLHVLDPKNEKYSVDVANQLITWMDTYGREFRTFKHGAFHGTLAGFMIALPIIATGSMFEKKGAKYILINAGYWIITMALMGGIICQFA